MKAQFSIELIVVSAIILLIISSLFTIWMDKEEDVRKANQMWSAKKIVREIAAKINNVLQCGNGCSIELYLSEEMVGEYTFRTFPPGRRVEIIMDGEYVNALILTNNIENISVKSGEKVRITNINNRIYLVVV